MSPAMLKVLVGAWKVILFSRAASLTEANGMCLCPKMAMSQCISSLMTRIFLFLQKSASLTSVLRSQHIPAGLWGLQRMRMRHLSSAILSRLSKSISYVPLFSRSGLNTTSRPLPCGTSRKGWYTGVWMITFSSGLVKMFTTRPMPLTMPGMNDIHSRRTFH